MASLASHVGSAEVSNLVPAGNRSSIFWIIFGAPPNAPGSLQVIKVESPVETPGSDEKNAIWNVARNSELAPAVLSPSPSRHSVNTTIRVLRKGTMRPEGAER